MVEFRRSLASSFLFKGLLYVALPLEAEVGPSYRSPFPENYRSGARVCSGAYSCVWGIISMLLPA